MADPIRDQLAEVLHARAGDLPGPATNCRACMGDADALLPLVESYAAQQAAEALRDAARDVDDGEFSDRWSDAARRALLARAAALDPNGGQQ